ncbi:LysR family transcriptional regulator [Flavisphingomonas formosensis]|uniref:LysR family transcriptional regulator n=1 Tax=Flavisphingomonas formosensis TaxID=861534 RepID=UPI0022B7605B|nr:LysR family transcriptional regulator [Sphingomonas formosensis]
MNRSVAAPAQPLQSRDIHAFLIVAETGSLRQAAEQLNISVNTVRSRIERLEKERQASLFTRTRTGAMLTPAGRELQVIAMRLRTELSLRNRAVDDSLIAPGELRVGASEAIGSTWLTPHILDLQTQFPELTISIQCDYDLKRDRSHELDCGLVFYPPANPELITAKIATLHFLLFASKRYIMRNGAPTSLHDMVQNHKFIEQSAPGVNSHFLDLLIGLDRPKGFMPLRTNSSLALFWAVANDIGVALMPTYVVDLTNRLVPLDLPVQFRFDLYYYYHPEARDAPPLRATIDWLKHMFDPVRYPWFREDFVHPRDVDIRRRDGRVVNLFASMTDD